MLCHPKPSVQDGVSKLICPRISHPFQAASALDRETRIEAEGEIHNDTTQALVSVKRYYCARSSLSISSEVGPALTFFFQKKIFFFFFPFVRMSVYIRKQEATKLKTQDYCDTLNVVSHKSQDYFDTLNVSSYSQSEAISSRPRPPTRPCCSSQH